MYCIMAETRHLSATGYSTRRTTVSRHKSRASKSSIASEPKVNPPLAPLFPNETLWSPILRGKVLKLHPSVAEG